MPPWEVMNLLLLFPLIYQWEAQIMLGNSENTLQDMPKTWRENAFINVLFFYQTTATDLITKVN